MTLETYDPDRFNELALRLMDLTGQLRRIAIRSQQEGLDPLPLNDKKALEWLGKLEEWVLKTEQEVERQSYKALGQRKALAMRRSKGPLSEVSEP